MAPAAVALLVGVVGGVWLQAPPSGLRVLLVAVWVIAVAAVCLRAGPVLVAGVLVGGFTVGGLLLGATRHAVALETPLARWFAGQPGADTGRVGPVLLEGRLRADATATDYGVALRLTVERIGRAGAMRTTAGGVRLSVGGRRWVRRAAGWRAGSLVRVWATLRPPARYRNPGVADQARRRAMRGTALLGSVKSGLLVELLRPGSPPAELAAPPAPWSAGSSDGRSAATASGRRLSCPPIVGLATSHRVHDILQYKPYMRHPPSNTCH